MTNNQKTVTLRYNVYTCLKGEKGEKCLYLSKKEFLNYMRIAEIIYQLENCLKICSEAVCETVGLLTTNCKLRIPSLSLFLMKTSLFNKLEFLGMDLQFTRFSRFLSNLWKTCLVENLFHSFLDRILIGMFWEAQKKPVSLRNSENYF